MPEDKPLIPTGVTRPVSENVIVWKDPLEQFQTGERFHLRVWVDVSDLPVKPRIHNGMLNIVMLNNFDMRPYQDVSVSSDHALAIAKEVARMLKFVTVQVNAVEVTVGGEGSLYYPEWP